MTISFSSVLKWGLFFYERRGLTTSDHSPSTGSDSSGHSVTHWPSAISSSYPTAWGCREVTERFIEREVTYYTDFWLEVLRKTGKNLFMIIDVPAEILIENLKNASQIILAWGNSLCVLKVLIYFRTFMKILGIRKIRGFWGAGIFSYFNVSYRLRVIRARKTRKCANQYWWQPDRKLGCLDISSEHYHYCVLKCPSGYFNGEFVW
jgi:hypothetical protein